MISDIPLDIFKFKMNFDVSEVHKTTVRILEELGIYIGSKKCLELLNSIGCDVDYKTLKARIPESIINKALSYKQPEHKVYNRAGDSYVIYGGNNLLISSCAAAIRVRDYGGKYHDATLKDLERMTRIHDYYDYVDIIQPAVDPADIPRETLRTKMAATVFKNTNKSCWFVASTPEVVKDIFDMGVAIRGSEKNLREKPFFRIGAASESLLGFQKTEAELLMKCAELGIPTGNEHYPIMGLTAPLSISGALAITNANYLAAHVIKTSIDPYNPSMYIVMAGSFNMKNANIIASSPEIWQYYLAGIKLGQHYNIPTCVLLSTDSKYSDSQMAYEKGIGSFLCASAGVNNIFGATCELDAMNLVSYEQVIIDLEFISSMSNYFKGFSLNTSEFDFDLIKRSLDNKMYFLDDEHTLNNYKNFIWDSEIFIKDNFKNWINSDMPKVIDNAHVKVEEILKKHFATKLPDATNKNIDEIIMRAKNRLKH